MKDILAKVIRDILNLFLFPLKRISRYFLLLIFCIKDELFSFLNFEVVVRHSLNKKAYYYYKKKRFFLLMDSWSLFFFFLDLFYLKVYVTLTKKFQLIDYEIRLKTRLNQTSWLFYQNLSVTNFINSFINHYLSGLRYLLIGFKYWILPLILGFSSFYYLSFIRNLDFNKVLFGWFLIIMFLYWFLSGFTFFIKKYQYSKFTSVIQRFWKRSYILFWCIESGTFLVFFYLTLNAPEEPVFMYDQIKVYKSHLFSWKLFLPKLIPVISLIILSYYLLLNLKWTYFSRQIPILTLITFILLYVFWLEFYQFYHLIHYYRQTLWTYEPDISLWNIKSESQKTRILNNIFTICLVAKFWHLVFIFIFWVFFLLRINEINRIRYSFLAANIQNFIILYIMSWLYMYPWLKFVFRRHLENQYYWYFYNARRLGMRIFFNDLLLFIPNFLKYFNFFKLTFFKETPFFYWIESSTETNLLQYKKHIIRDLIIEILN